MEPPEKVVFVTVGTTSFDKLISTLDCQVQKLLADLNLRSPANYRYFEIPRVYENCFTDRKVIIID